MMMEIEVRTTKKVFVAPCIKCGSDDIMIWDNNDSAFNTGGGTCKKCKHEVTGGVGCLPKKTEMVGIWNAANHPRIVLEKELKDLMKLKASQATLKKQIDESRRRLAKFYKNYPDQA
ncbi:hypothetical protein GCM10028807_32860 [Spirosoma daeguense]